MMQPGRELPVRVVGFDSENFVHCILDVFLGIFTLFSYFLLSLTCVACSDVKVIV
jgi:hypothetical protein